MAEIQKMTDELAKEMTVYIPKKPQTFQEFLNDKHMSDYHGTDDDAPDAEEAWESNLDVQEVIELAEEWGATLV